MFVPRRWLFVPETRSFGVCNTRVESSLVESRFVNRQVDGISEVGADGDGSRRRIGWVSEKRKSRWEDGLEEGRVVVGAELGLSVKQDAAEGGFGLDTDT